MNIYGKIQKVIVGLQKVKIKKSGKNNFAKFEYFELSDFLPPLNELLDQYGLYCHFNFFEQEARLTVWDSETSENADFISPVAPVELKGCHPVQNLGGMQTYLRRYLLINAFAISENEMVDSAPQDYQKITKDQLNNIYTLADGMDKNKILRILQSYGYKKSTDVTTNNYNNVIEKIQEAKTHNNDGKISDTIKIN